MTPPRRTIRVTTVFLLLALLVIWSVLDVRLNVVDSLDRDDPPQSPTAHESVAITPVEMRSVAIVDDDAVEAERPIDRELAAASWRNPFESRWWRAPGWTVETDGMRGTGSARFRKPFVGVSLSLVIEGLDEQAVPLPSIRLENADDHRLAVVVFWDRDAVAVSRERPGHEPRTVREMELPASVKGREQPHRRLLQVVATGNRLVIAESRKRLIFCDQPSEIAGTPFYITIDAGDQVLRVSDIRMDGE